MVRILAAALLLTGLTATAEARDLFRGTMLTTSYTGDCPDWVTGQEYSVRYSPKTASNGTNSSFSLIGNDYAQSFTLFEKEFDATLRAVQWGEIWTDVGIIKPSSKNPPPVRVSFKTIARTPSASATTSATEFLNITGSIQNFEPWDTKTCILNFRMSLVRKEPL